MAHFNLSKLSCDIIFYFITCLSRRRESDSRPLSYQESVLPLNYSGIILANFSFLIQSLNPNTNASMAFAPVWAGRDLVTTLICLPPNQVATPPRVVRRRLRLTTCSGMQILT